LLYFNKLWLQVWAVQLVVTFLATVHRVDPRAIRVAEDKKVVSVHRSEVVTVNLHYVGVSFCK